MDLEGVSGYENDDKISLSDDTFRSDCVRITGDANHVIARRPCPMRAAREAPRRRAQGWGGDDAMFANGVGNLLDGVEGADRLAMDGSGGKLWGGGGGGPVPKPIFPTRDRGLMGASSPRTGRVDAQRLVSAQARRTPARTSRASTRSPRTLATGTATTPPATRSPAATDAPKHTKAKSRRPAAALTHPGRGRRPAAFLHAHPPRIA